MTSKTSRSSIHNFKFKFDKLSGAQAALTSFKKPTFKKLRESERYEKISEALLKLIQKEKAPCFLLPAVASFIDEVNQIITPDVFSFSYFEFYLNQYSQLSESENLFIRSKIAGRHIPREDYQILFPIGMNKTYPGSHYVTAHGSPDLDTTIASFWGWLDAFSARVSSGLHIWNVPPGGIFTSKEAAPLTDVFSSSLFRDFAINQSSLAPGSIDFAQQSDLIKKHLSESTVSPEEHERHKRALMVVDDKGYYVGDIRSEDYEGIRQIIRLVTNNIKWFENAIQTKFIELFSKSKVTLEQMQQQIKHLYDLKIIDCVSTRQLTDKLHERVDLYLKNILGINKGLEASFRELAHRLKQLKISKLEKLEKGLIDAFKKHKVFDAKGQFSDERMNIFKALSTVSENVDEAIEELRAFMETLDIAIQIKRRVFGFAPRFVTPFASLDEIQDKMSVLNHLSVVFPNPDGSFWPLGIIKAKDLKPGKLGTVSLRDFCNRSEVNIDSNLEIISVIDHHKTELKTKTPPLAITGDVQSCNILVAEQSFLINDQYSRGAVSTEALKKQLGATGNKKLSDSMLRQQKRLLKRLLAQSAPKSYFVDPQREFLEYLSYLHAIIDDTDLFSKATKRDVFCIAEIINRLKSISQSKDCEIVNFDNVKDDENFVKNAVKEIVTNNDVYQIYKEIFRKRELFVENTIKETVSGKSFEFFSDTKEQNGCCRIGQSKVFTKNIPTIQKNLEKLISLWVEKAQEIYEGHEPFDLHMHMTSTIPSADDVYKQGPPNYKHQDMLWVWTPGTSQGIHHLTNFLNAFKNSPKVAEVNMQVQVLDASQSDYPSLLKNHFGDVFSKQKLPIKKKMPVIVFTFDAGTLNSRKAQLTPYLPSLVK